MRRGHEDPQNRPFPEKAKDKSNSVFAPVSTVPRHANMKWMTLAARNVQRGEEGGGNSVPPDPVTLVSGKHM